MIQDGGNFPTCRCGRQKGRKGRIEDRQKKPKGTQMKRESVFNVHSHVVDHGAAQPKWLPAGENGAGRVPA
jgi:hypothetical protein